MSLLKIYRIETKTIMEWSSTSIATQAIAIPTSGDLLGKRMNLRYWVNPAAAFYILNNVINNIFENFV